MPTDTSRIRNDESVPTTKLRNVRIDERLWNEAMRIARQRRETLSHVIKAALVEYVLRHGGDLGDE